MWSGNPVSYLEPLPTEKIESDKSVPEITPLKQENGTIYQKKVVRYITFAATDGSYKRSLVSTRSGLVRSPDSTNYGSETHYVLGIKYKNQKIYDQYLSSYLAFKNSLVAYAD